MCFSLALNWLKCTPRVFILRLNKTSKRFPGCLLLMLVVLDLKLSNLLWPNVLLHLSHWRKQDGTDSKISATLEPQLLQPTLSHSTSPVQKVGGGWGEGMGGLNSDLWHYPQDLHVTLLCVMSVRSQRSSSLCTCLCSGVLKRRWSRFLFSSRDGSVFSFKQFLTGIWWHFFPPILILSKQTASFLQSLCESEVPSSIIQSLISLLWSSI